MIKIALVGNPNAGKTTLFNFLTGSNQFVGNWPGVTVEKKEGKLKGHTTKDDEVIIIDLPGIYSLSPYTLEELVSREFLVNERPDVILNIIDGTNIERNLYLTNQLTELGIPMLVAINMMDIVKKNGDKINTEILKKELRCDVIEISAIKGKSCLEAAELAISVAKEGKKINFKHNFEGCVEHALAHIEEACVHDLPAEKHRWYSVKLFERDKKVIEKLDIPEEKIKHIESDIQACENEMEDNSENIITTERYKIIDSIIKKSCVLKNKNKLSTSDKIDRVVTNRWFALPILAAVMFLIYFISISTIGTWATDWTNEGLFGDGFFLFGKDRSAYEKSLNDYAAKNIWNDDLITYLETEDSILGKKELLYSIQQNDFRAFEENYKTYSDNLDSTIAETISLKLENLPSEGNFSKWWIPGIPIITENFLQKIKCAPWLMDLILEGIIGGVGAVLGFVPQMMVLFFFLAFLEACGYMARIAFIMDRIFRKFGLSGKSFIPILIGTGCGVPGIMASRTIENLRDRRITIMTTTFIPCGAKLPVIALISSVLFDGAPWVAPSAYFMGILAIICSGIILKKTKAFAGDTSHFVMELPAYHLPDFKNVMHSMWERSWSFIKKAGTIILLSSIIIWIASSLGMTQNGFGFDSDLDLESSILGYIGKFIKWIFIPLGFGNIKATIATFMGFIAKEEIVSVFGVLDFEGLSKLSGYSFLIFNLLCAPCLSAIAAMKNELNSAKWTWAALLYQTGFAYSVSLCIFQFGSLFTGNANILGLIFALIVLIIFCYFLFRKAKTKPE